MGWWMLVDLGPYVLYSTLVLYSNDPLGTLEKVLPIREVFDFSANH